MTRSAIRALRRASRPPKRAWRTLRKRLRVPVKRLRKRVAPLGPAQVRDRRALRRVGVTALLRTFGRDRPRAAIHPEWDDLRFLYDLVRDQRPTTLLELGSGYSTVVLAAALRSNGAGHLWTLDADETWATATEAGLPDVLRPFVTVIRCAAVEDNRDVAGWRHTNIPDIEPDFLYLDSPPLTSDRQIAFDPLDLEPRFAPAFSMVVDGRHRNARYLEAHLTGEYRFSYHAGGVSGRYLFERRS